MRSYKILTVIVLLCVVIPAQAKVQFIRPFEYSHGIVFSYGTSGGNLFIPASNGQFPSVVLDNLTLLFIPDQGITQFTLQVFYGRLNTTSSSFTPLTSKNHTVNVQGRTASYNLKLSVTEHLSYVMIAVDDLELTFSYTSTDDAIILSQSKNTFTQMLTQNIVIAGIIALMSALAGGIIVRRAGVLVIPTELYYFVAGISIVLIAVLPNLAISTLYVVIGIVSFFVAAKKFEPDLQQINLDVFHFENGKLKEIAPYNLLVDTSSIVHESFVDMFLRIFGVRTKFPVKAGKNWALQNELYFATSLEITPPKFVIEIENLVTYLLLGLAVLAWFAVNQMFSIILVALVLVGVLTYSRFSEFTLIRKGTCTIEYVDAIISSNLAHALMDLGYVYTVSKQYISLQDENHALRIKMEESTYTRARTLSKQVLDMVSEVIKNGSRNIQDTGSREGRPQNSNNAAEQKSSGTRKVRKSDATARTVESSSDKVDI